MALLFSVMLWLAAPAYPTFVSRLPFPQSLKHLPSGVWVGFGRMLGGAAIGAALTGGGVPYAVLGGLAALVLHSVRGYVSTRMP